MSQEINLAFKFEYQTPTEITIEESASGSAIIEGVLLSEGVSRNGNMYTLPEMENIARQSEGIPIYYGVRTGINPKTGLICKTLHDNREEQKIGKIIKTRLDKNLKKIFFVAEVFNTDKHPNIINQIKSGWGVSIGGFVTKADYVIDKIGRKLLKVKDMVVNHLSVIPPTIVRGMDSAKIDNVQVQETFIPIQESMMFDLPIEETYQPDETIVVFKGSGIKDIRVE